MDEYALIMRHEDGQKDSLARADGDLDESTQWTGLAVSPLKTNL